MDQVEFTNIATGEVLSIPAELARALLLKGAELQRAQTKNQMLIGAGIGAGLVIGYYGTKHLYKRIVEAKAKKDITEE